MPSSTPRFVVQFRELRLSDIPRVGGKNASPGELIASVQPLGVRVPDGFALTAAAFTTHLAQAGIDGEIYAALDRLDVQDVTALAAAGRRIRDLVRSAPLPASIDEERKAAYRALSRSYEETKVVTALAR